MFDGKYLEWNQRRIKCIIDFYGHKFMYMKKVLDLGAGQADIGGALYRLGADVTAVDARQEHLQIATKKFQGIKTVKADLERGWPFGTQKYDLILDLALLCHLRDFKSHLIAVCAATNNLVLETAVLDSDEDKCVNIDENKGIYENSVNGMGCRPSAAAIERVLSDCGMSFTRVDSSRLNAGPFVYDWQSQNNGDTSINKRRLWFCNRTGAASLNFATGTPTSPVNAVPKRLNTIQPAVMARPPYSSHGPDPNSQPTNTDPPKSSVSYIPMQLDTVIEEVRQTSRRFAISPANALNRYPNLKVLYVPLGDQKGMVDAWNNIGVQLKVYDFWTVWNNSGRNNNKINQDLIRIASEFKPKFIHMQLQMTGIITYETVAQIKKNVPCVIISNWTGDIRVNVIHEMNTMSRVIDYTLISSTGQLDLYRRAGANNVKYWQVGYDPKCNFPQNYNSFEYDISFIANHYGSHFPDSHIRLAAVQKCQAIFTNKFGLFGSGWPNNNRTCESKQSNDIYNRSVCPLSISNFNSVSHYFSDRFLYCVASGRPTISWHFPGIESYFVEGKEILIARNVDDIVKHVNFCKSNPAQANAIGKAGAERAQAEHTFTSKVLELLHIVGLDK